MKRRKRSVGNMTRAEEDSEEEDTHLESPEETSNSSFSESLRLFQSIQVLANEEEIAALRNETAESESDDSAIFYKFTHTNSRNYSYHTFAEVLVEAADYCFSSMMFTSMVGLVTVLLLMSGELMIIRMLRLTLDTQVCPSHYSAPGSRGGTRRARRARRMLSTTHSGQFPVSQRHPAVTRPTVCGHLASF